MDTLRRGSNGGAVAALQWILGITPDGDFGRQTEATVKAWQKEHGLTADGIVGANTWRTIALSRPTLKLGDNGGSVAALQCLLDGLAIDGKYGALTEATVRSWQAAHGLSADGLAGEKTWRALLCGEVAASTGMRPVDYKQYDSRWARVMYSSHGDKAQTIKSSGCGPTALANIVATWYDATVTPVETCALATLWGHRTYNDGTSRAFFDRAAKYWPFEAYSRTTSTDKAMDALRRGALVIALMGPGYWTKGGHYITLWQCDGDTLYACDPASSSRTSSSVAIFRAQAREYFVFWRA